MRWIWQALSWPHMESTVRHVLLSGLAFTLDGWDTVTTWWDICGSGCFVSLGTFIPSREIHIREHLPMRPYGISPFAFSVLLIMPWQLSSWVTVHYMVWRQQRDTSNSFIKSLIHAWFFQTWRLRCQGHQSGRPLMRLLLMRMESVSS